LRPGGAGASYDRTVLRVAVQVLTVLVGLWVISGTVINLSRNPHWYVRGWDFPRPVILALALLSGIPYALFFSRDRWYDLALLGALAAAVAVQLHRIFPYTPLGPRPVKDARRPGRDQSFRLVISNVLIENRDHARWLAVVKAAQPDLVVALEPDEAWMAALRSLEETHPHVVAHPLGNAYGMALFSRLPLTESRVEFLVQEDIPSIHTRFGLPGGATVRLHVLHPRPPEPLRHQDSKPRDAELLKVARFIEEAPDEPTVVAGDLNDVAWSYTTQLFLRESGLLDPRLGRGFFNTFNANNPLFRFPLDHVFHSNHFRLVELRRLPHVGSDHFPVLIALSYEPDAQAEQEKPRPTSEDDRAAAEMIERGHDAPRQGDGA
jgi:endonuclease/exonuclease/phosphatase (EEP) superfamily protein YafD